jgi:hypothetical protein
MALLQPGLSAQQLVTYAAEIAKAPGFTSQAGDLLNMILAEIAQSYSIAQSQSFFTITFTVSPLTSTVNSANVVAGSGPYALPDDFLRMDRGDFWWQLGGINYFPTPMDIAEFDALVQQPGFNSYPTAYAIDTSTVPYGLYIWPASSGAYQAFGRYHKQTTDITTPSSSSTVPWFPYQLYLQTRLAAELMMFSGDVRRDTFLATSRNMLSRFLDLEGNNSTRAATVTLDPRKFGRKWNLLPATKAVPW